MSGSPPGERGVGAGGKCEERFGPLVFFFFLFLFFVLFLFVFFHLEKKRMRFLAGDFSCEM